MDNIAVKAIDAVIKGKQSYCKFLSANDTGETGSNQSGILISKTAKNMLWADNELQESHILKKAGHVKWQDDFSTDCMFTWYESKNELRMTRLGRGFPFLSPEYTGALFVLVKDSKDDYQGFVLNTDDEIEEFLEIFGLTPAETNRPIEIRRENSEEKERQAIDKFVSGLKIDFPSTADMASAARTIQYEVYLNRHLILDDPDKMLLLWTEEEYRVFRAIEYARYGGLISKGFSSVDDFIVLANTVLNRRKSRAGKSLEHHLSAIFDENRIRYSSQAITEGRKKPDFLFPSKEAYHDKTFDIDKLCMLAAKTTCKDRWRQILKEAKRFEDENKYLCTLQQGISSQQMDEMREEKVILVVPREYHRTYPKEKREYIWTIERFIGYVKEMEGING